MQPTPPQLGFAFDLDRPRVRHLTAITFGLLALALRLWHLGVQPLWFDEALTAHIAHAPHGLAFVHNTPPLYFLLVSAWSQWFGVGASGLRSLSALLGALFVWVTLHAAYAAFGKRAALAATLLALACPLHLYYSQEARAYALLLTELMTVYWLLWQLAQRARPALWFGLVLASSAALYTHYLAAIPLGIAYLSIGLGRGGQDGRQHFVAISSAGLVAGATLVPWLAWWSQHTAFASSDMQWLTILWQQMSAVGAVLTSFEMFLLSGQAGHSPIFLKQLSDLPFPELLRAAALLAMTALLVRLLLSLRRLPSAARAATLQCTALGLGPLLALAAASSMRPIYCPARYDLIAWPGFVLLMGQAIACATARPGLWHRALAWSAITGLTVAILWKDLGYFVAPAGPDPSPRVAAYLVANVPDDDTVVLCGSVGLPVLAKLYEAGFVWSQGRCRRSQSGQEFACRLLPPELETAPAAISRYLHAVANGELAPALEQMVVADGTRGVWLVLGDDLRSGANAALERAGQSLFAVMHAAGYRIEGGDPSLGVAHLTRPLGR